MTDNRQGVAVRGLLAILALVMLAFTLPAYFDTSNNPGLANLSGEAASLGSVAGAFLARQFALALIALYGAVQGRTAPVMIGAFGLAFLNLHDAIFLSINGNIGPGAIAGLVLGGLASVVMVLAWRHSKARA